MIPLSVEKDDTCFENGIETVHAFTVQDHMIANQLRI